MIFNMFQIQIQMMRAQWRDERAASREAIAILRALIDDASDSARVTALTARVQALEAASAAGIRPSSPSAAAEQAATSAALHALGHYRQQPVRPEVPKDVVCL